jgi:hypothetical protein
MLTGSDGLRISEVSFNGKPVLRSAKLVDWHVSYSGTDGFGYSDAIGCPYFSQAAVVAWEIPKVSVLMDDNNKQTGFVLEQVFRSEGWPTPCNYNYRQRYEFYNDGRFRVACASIGRGCGNDGTYRPVFRIAFAGSNNNFSNWNGNGWTNWAKEQWKEQNSSTTYSPEGALYKMDGNNAYYIQPGHGQFHDGGRGDFSFVYITKHTVGRDEGENDLTTIGPCCNIDYHQGPEKFIEPQPEDISNSSLVMTTGRGMNIAGQNLFCRMAFIPRMFIHVLRVQCLSRLNKQHENEPTIFISLQRMDIIVMRRREGSFSVEQLQNNAGICKNLIRV